VVVLVLVILAPFLWLLQMSIKTQADIFAFPPKVVFVPTLEHYRTIWDTAFRRSFANSAVVGVVSTGLAMLLGVPGAYALSRARFRAAGALTLWILVSRMAPPIAFTIPYFLAYRHLGLLDTRTGLVIVYLTFNLSLVIWLMRSFFDATPRSLEEAAWIDGASLGQGFVRIVLPLSAPGLAATAILCFLYAWNDFFFAVTLTYTQSPTLPIMVAVFSSTQELFLAKVSALATAIILVPVILGMYAQQHLVRGLTGGALK